MAISPQEHVYHISAGSVAKAILVFLLFVVLYILRDLFLVVLAAVVIASAIEPMTRWFIKYKIRRLPAVVFIYAGLTILLIGIFYFLVLPVLGETSSLLSDLPSYLGVEKSVPVTNTLTSLSVPQSVVAGLTEKISFKEIAFQLNRFLSNLSEGFWSTVSFAFGGILSFVLIVVLSFYLAVQENGISNFLSMISPAKHRAYVISLWRRAENKIGLWMQGQVILAVIVAVLVYLGLTLIGVKHALLLAVLAGIFELIPVFGPILSAIPGVAIAFINMGLSTALFVTGLYLIIQQFENHLIYPLVVKKVVGVPPVVVILALVAGAKLAGFLGILLSVPIAAVLLEFFHDFQNKPIEPAQAMPVSNGSTH